VGRHAEHARSLRRRIAIRTAAVMRWLHIYSSMFGLAVVLFFSVTGLTLNHPDWFGEPERRVSAQGRMDPRWLHLDVPVGSLADGDEADESRQVAKLEVVEYLRKIHGVRGALAEFRADQEECTVTFKGPGYAADAFIDRESGRYDLTQTIHGFVAVINDLHKGRDTGRAWSAVIDASAIALTIISLSGLVLLFYLKRRRIPGLLMVAGGAVAVVSVVRLFVH
jgi:hypothetical protein